VEARRSDDSTVTAIDGDERASRSEMIREELPEGLLLVPCRHRMLLPDQWIRRNTVEVGEVAVAKRPQLDDVGDQAGLRIEGTTDHGFVGGCR
jgi:hypothetical protein